MLEISVEEPTRTGERYEFTCRLREPLSWRRRLARSRAPAAESSPSEIRFGFTATNFTIRHNAVWDSVYPLLYLTRNGGPLFNRGHDRARIRFEYPISPLIRDFYVRRAANFGLGVAVDGPLAEVRLDRSTSGRVLAFGGGKDSRMILGAMRELGIGPTPVMASRSIPPDVPETLVTRSISKPVGVLADRIMPSLMTMPRHLYLGGGLGEAHLETPWQQYYDMGSPRALADWSELFRSLGATIEFHVPGSVLPYNITQRILSERYPELAAGQVSVAPGWRVEKNLHVCLLKDIHGIDFSDHCDSTLFGELLEQFVVKQTTHPRDFGFRNSRETINREMRALIWRMRDAPLYAAVRDRIPADWDADWIDYIHPYVSPVLDSGFLDIYREHASTIDEAPRGSRIRRINV